VIDLYSYTALLLLSVAFVLYQESSEVVPHPDNPAVHHLELIKRE